MDPRSIPLSWQQLISAICKWILLRMYLPMKFLGFVFEWTTNLVYQNGGLFGLFFKLLFIWRWGEINWPNIQNDIYLSCVGALDPREELQVDLTKSKSDFVLQPEVETDRRRTADMCAMAAKLAYENKQVVKRVVETKWKMHFVKFLNCWNETQKENNTHAFICMDKKKDAESVVVAFRGTEAFNMLNWSTDIDFNWAHLEKLGNVHQGFLEALGLADRKNPPIVTKLVENALREKNPSSHATDPREEGKRQISSAVSGLSELVDNDKKHVLAFEAITKKVVKLLSKNPRAKLLITGHSLGGALASLYAVMLFYMGQTEVASKIAGVYTFGQPRIGDEDLGHYANGKLEDRYFRVVYCNDVVPRVPFDNYMMMFEHFGRCYYINSCYHWWVLRDQPNPNFFGRFWTMRVNALWELVQGAVLVPLQHGRGYAESWSSIAFRAMGILMPGISSHSPCNYVNAVRLAPMPFKDRLKVPVDMALEVQLFLNNIEDALQSVVTTPFELLGIY